MNEYGEKITQVEEQYGQTANYMRVLTAIKTMDDVWTVRDIMDVTGVPERTTRRIVGQLQTVGFIEQVDEKKTLGKPIPYYRLNC
ncbi:helix-turn-helix domain-containing protein [Halovenus sp. WSH3]|uniref:Helix-turn-helix domain-containing protein n=1 Tax=Halovenus carboxidivorans TaxID=2692199 RepID=A0A6B0SXW8_9EURY|nr:helix-turn-helix domain-containing protein [Halovenus carboxidivorans]